MHLIKVIENQGLLELHRNVGEYMSTVDVLSSYNFQPPTPPFNPLTPKIICGFGGMFILPKIASSISLFY